uniref:Kinesin family member 26B n=1 Tax=Gasterosteus aculeatus aculeatus TaxID=481459 RepID=A0AAQ4QTE5_GASAC
MTGQKDFSSYFSLQMPDTSPTKAASFFPDTWYRKAYDENSRTRPAPEGAGSMPSSTGTPSPGSGISSPGSFSGSPGTISPGIGTESPGSLGGSPGFGTGSPASGSGSSPGSERVIWCENCNARLSELKRQALKLLIPGPYSSKDPSFSLLLHDKLQVPNSSWRAWNERDSRCDVCATHLTQLKQEAVRLVLTLDQWDLSPPSSPPSHIERYGSQGPPGSYGSIWSTRRSWFTGVDPCFSSFLLLFSCCTLVLPVPFPESQPDPNAQPEPRTIQPRPWESLGWTNVQLCYHKPTTSWPWAQIGVQAQFSGAWRWGGQKERVPRSGKSCCPASHWSKQPWQ